MTFEDAVAEVNKESVAYQTLNQATHSLVLNFSYDGDDEVCEATLIAFSETNDGKIVSNLAYYSSYKPCIYFQVIVSTVKDFVDEMLFHICGTLGLTDTYYTPRGFVRLHEYPRKV